MEVRPSGHQPSIETEPPLDLRELRYFLAVAEELNFTRAATRLHIAQQALSATIRQLEDTLGVRLFDRSTRHVSLTSAGELLVHSGRRILVEVDAALEEVRLAAAGRQGRLVLGVAIAVHGAPVVRESIRRFSDLTPAVELQVIGFDHADPTAGMSSGSSQAAFVLAPLIVEGLESIEVLREPRAVLLPADHRLADRAEVHAEDLAGLPWLRAAAPDSAWTRFWFRNPAGETGEDGPEIRSGVEWIPAIESGRAVGYSLHTLAKDYLPPTIRAVPVVDVEPGSVLLCWPRDAADPLVDAFVATVREVMAQLGR